MPCHVMQSMCTANVGNPMRVSLTIRQNQETPLMIPLLFPCGGGERMGCSCGGLDQWRVHLAAEFRFRECLLRWDFMMGRGGFACDLKQTWRRNFRCGLWGPSWLLFELSCQMCTFIIGFVVHDMKS